MYIVSLAHLSKHVGTIRNNENDGLINPETRILGGSSNFIGILLPSDPSIWYSNQSSPRIDVEPPEPFH